jgi:hypothetical protein
MLRDRPGLSQLKNNIEKSKKMLRQAAPVTVENKGMIELEVIGEALYRKTQAKNKRRRKSFLSRIF